MSTMIPVPILTLMTAKKLEQYVCGMEEIDIMMLKKVVRYIIQYTHHARYMYVPVYTCGESWCATKDLQLTAPVLKAGHHWMVVSFSSFLIFASMLYTYSTCISM